MDTLFPALFVRPIEPYSPYAPLRRRRAPSHAADARRRSWATEVARIADQMARVAATVPWGRVQNDPWDELSRFVYRTRSAASARARAEAVAAERGLEPVAFVSYALRRWYCFWGARMAELLFLRHPGVEPGPPRHREIDFYVDGVPFDLKTSEVPRRFVASVEELAADPTKIASWLYANQSRERRFHNANRLFLLLCDPEDPDEAWRLRGDAEALRDAIDGFMARPRFVELAVPEGPGRTRPALTAVVPVVRRPGPRQLRMGLGTGGLVGPAAPRRRDPAPADRQPRLFD